MAGQWHPIFLTREVRPGLWEMKHSHEIESFGRIELRRVGEQVRYKVTHGDVLIGWATSLEVARVALLKAERTARERVYAGPPNGRY
ncbi:MAG: hypothetical protein BGN97_03795 [Microbacterium sp. 69-10]|uniref:hypothetical protein n=1 Tax=Microbacterium sp. 69-10 TaxID=1895783 RepID=UPI00095E3CB0|nr:hypothetical protein [Microbacterium sp. 69-10]OJU41834.1 MAG: hypothetical protein BGN97_03795 [Microbacterium sp. 69-10]